MVYMKPSAIQSFSDTAIHPVGTPVSSPPMPVNILEMVDHPEKKWVMVGNSLLCLRVQNFTAADSHTR